VGFDVLDVFEEMFEDVVGGEQGKEEADCDEFQ
jgi:hypothetical protein